MIQLPMADDVTDRTSHAGFLIPRTEYQSIEPREDDRAGAHRARLEGYVQRAIVEAPAPKHSGGLTNGEHLGVRCRVLIALCPVCCLCEEPTVANDDGTDRNVAGRRGFRRDGQGLTHPSLIRRQAGQRPAPTGSLWATSALVKTISPSGPSDATM